jgi:hypothetical protein
MGMKVLVACEFSGVVRRAFRDKGHDAWSCDLLPSDDGSEFHIQGDVLDILEDGWDLMIAHPPCTWLCQAQATNAARKDRPKITAVYREERQKAFDFVMALYNAPIQKVAIENPIGYLNRKGVFRKPNQIVRPWMFGHEYKKDICLWLRGLQNLEPTKIIEPPHKKLDFWSTKRNPNGRSLKSITFEGVAQAMAEQWG